MGPFSFEFWVRVTEQRIIISTVLRVFPGGHLFALN